MSEDAGLRYSDEHLWFRRDGERVTVGVTQAISRILTWVDEVELPSPGTRLGPGDELLTIDSQKAAIAISAPVALEVVAVNEEVGRDPMLVRMDPRGRGWLLRVRLAEGGWERLLGTAAYREVVGPAA